MKLSDYIAEFLSKITDAVFVGQGGNIIHVLDSLGKRKDVRVIPSQNEQGASIAADAYSRFSNKIGVTAATSGPGMLNLMQGMACSFFDSIPTFHFSGAVVTGQLRKNKNIRQIGFQEMEVVDSMNPEQNIFGGTRYIRILANHFKGDLRLTLAAYNAGPKAVERSGSVPNYAETKEYVKRVIKLYRHYLKEKDPQ